MVNLLLSLSVLIQYTQEGITTKDGSSNSLQYSTHHVMDIPRSNK